MSDAEIERRCLRDGDPLQSDKGDDLITYLSDRFVTGRKQYTCACCWLPIPAGSRHRSLRMVVDDQVGGCRYCWDCSAAWAVYDEHPEVLEGRFELAAKEETL